VYVYVYGSASAVVTVWLGHHDLAFRLDHHDLAFRLDPHDLAFRLDPHDLAFRLDPHDLVSWVNQVTQPLPWFLPTLFARPAVVLPGGQRGQRGASSPVG